MDFPLKRIEEVDREQPLKRPLQELPETHVRKQSGQVQPETRSMDDFSTVVEPDRNDDDFRDELAHQLAEFVAFQR
jgi:hypothetical protein